jgi:hypothetical protein
VKAVEEHIRLCLLGCHRHPLPQQQPQLHSLPHYAVGDEVPLGRFVRILLHQLVQELLKSGHVRLCCVSQFRREYSRRPCPYEAARPALTT